MHIYSNVMSCVKFTKSNKNVTYDISLQFKYSALSDYLTDYITGKIAKKINRVMKKLADPRLRRVSIILLKYIWKKHGVFLAVLLYFLTFASFVTYLFLHTISHAAGLFTLFISPTLLWLDNLFANILRIHPCSHWIQLSLQFNVLYFNPKVEGLLDALNRLFCYSSGEWRHQSNTGLG